MKGFGDLPQRTVNPKLQTLHLEPIYWGLILFFAMRNHALRAF